MVSFRALIAGVAAFAVAAEATAAPRQADALLSILLKPAQEEFASNFADCTSPPANAAKETYSACALQGTAAGLAGIGAGLADSPIPLPEEAKAGLGAGITAVVEAVGQCVAQAAVKPCPQCLPTALAKLASGAADNPVLGAILGLVQQWLAAITACADNVPDVEECTDDAITAVFDGLAKFLGSAIDL